MDETHIEIHEVYALRVDADTRVGRLRVIGVADRDDQRINVEACVAGLGNDAPWRDQHADATARIVDPARTFAGYHDPVFVSDLFNEEAGRRRAYLWIAEIDLLLSPAVPRVFIGRQEVPVNVRAHYVFDNEAPHATLAVVDVRPVREFDAGVLFVHGIGQQRRAETLSQWSAPLLRWINAWLDGATDDLARKLGGAPLDGWLHSMVLRSDFGGYDVDYVDRARYAQALADKARAATSKNWREEMSGLVAMARSTAKERSPTDEEHADRDEVARIVAKDLHATAVGGGAEFREAYVSDVGARSVEPSSVEMHVEAMDGDGYMLRSRWMLAESHWGDSFWAPSFFGFARWCLMTAPILLVHYVSMARLRHATSPFRWCLAVMGIAASIAVAQLMFALLMVLWLVPWDKLRNYVLKIQMKLAGIVGDSYILLEDPVQRRAILDRVQRDLNWLLKRCRKVVVIAHSQGAAVAELVLSNLEESTTDTVSSFVTLGAGVHTLSAIERLSKSPAVAFHGWAAIGCVIAVGVAVVVALTGPWPVAAALAAAALLGLLLMATRASNMHPGRRKLLPRAGWLRPWLDFFATKDLVPYGPLVNPEDNGRNYHPKEVRNADSYLSDHVAYWNNPEQVVGPLAQEIGRAAGFEPLCKLLPDDAAVLDRLVQARFKRLGFMRLARGVMALATALLVYAQWAAWGTVGRWALDKLPSLVGAGAATVTIPGFSVWMQALAALLPFAIHMTLVSAIFDAWTTAEVERLLRRSAGSPARNWAITFMLLLALVLAATIHFVWPLLYGLMPR